MESSELGQYADGFVAWLGRLGYSPRTCEAQVALLRHMGRWLADQGVPLSGLSSEVAGEYAAARRGRAQLRSERALRPVLTYLRELGAIPSAAAVVPHEPVDVLLARFGGWLSRERGLALATVSSYLCQARPFADACGGQPGILTAARVSGLAAEGAAGLRPRSAQVRANAVRALLRFAWLEGLTAVPLAEFVGSFAAPAGPAAALIQHQAPEIMARVNMLLGQGEVTRLTNAIAALGAVNLAALDESRLASVAVYGRMQSLPTIQDIQPRCGEVQSALHQFTQQGAHHSRVLRRAFADAEYRFASIAANPKGYNHLPVLEWRAVDQHRAQPQLAQRTLHQLFHLLATGLDGPQSRRAVCLHAPGFWRFCWLLDRLGLLDLHLDGQRGSGRHPGQLPADRPRRRQARRWRAESGLRERSSTECRKGGNCSNRL